MKLIEFENRDLASMTKDELDQYMLSLLENIEQTLANVEERHHRENNASTTNKENR